MSLRIVLHREIPDDPRLHRQWNDLVLKMERPQVFYTYEWALAVQAAYRESIQPLLFLGYEGDRLAGVASLATDAAGENVSFLAATTGDYCDFLTQPSQRAEFVDAVFAELGKTKAGFLALANLPEDSATPAALRVAASGRGFHVYMRPAYLCAQVELGSGKQRQDLKTALAAKKKLRRTISRGLRAAEIRSSPSLDVPFFQLTWYPTSHVRQFLLTMNGHKCRRCRLGAGLRELRGFGPDGFW